MPFRFDGLPERSKRYFFANFKELTGHDRENRQGGSDEESRADKAKRQTGYERSSLNPREEAFRQVVEQERARQDSVLRLKKEMDELLRRDEDYKSAEDHKLDREEQAEEEERQRAAAAWVQALFPIENTHAPAAEPAEFISPAPEEAVYPSPKKSWRDWVYPLFSSKYGKIALYEYLLPGEREQLEAIAKRPWYRDDPDEQALARINYRWKKFGPPAALQYIPEFPVVSFARWLFPNSVAALRGDRPLTDTDPIGFGLEAAPTAFLRPLATASRALGSRFGEPALRRVSPLLADIVAAAGEALSDKGWQISQRAADIFSSEARRLKGYRWGELRFNTGRDLVQAYPLTAPIKAQARRRYRETDQRK